MIKVLAPAQRHPTNRSLERFHRYWAESHGPLFANTTKLRRYVQHLTLPEAYGHDPTPTFDGVSMFWYDDVQSRRVITDDSEILALLAGSRGVAVDPSPPRADASGTDPMALALLRAVLKDDAQLFDRSTEWPQHLRGGAIMAEERVIVEGATTPEMVKLLLIGGKKPGLTLDQFFRHWSSQHAALTSRLPGLRRYVQNHAIPEAYRDRGQSHDGWAELWFDDLAGLHAATGAPEWRAIQEDAADLFAEPVGIGVARERIQKDHSWQYNDWGVAALDEREIRARLSEHRYLDIANDREGARKIKAAAAREALAVWTDEHLVTIDDSSFDARPA